MCRKKLHICGLQSATILWEPGRREDAKNKWLSVRWRRECVDSYSYKWLYTPLWALQHIYTIYRVSTLLLENHSSPGIFVLIKKYLQLPTTILIFLTQFGWDYSKTQITQFAMANLILNNFLSHKQAFVKRCMQMQITGKQNPHMLVTIGICLCLKTYFNLN